jgi:hypothetical protein
MRWFLLLVRAKCGWHGQVFVVAIKRASKAAAWATQYARLCANLKTAAQPLQLDETVQDALYGRSTQEYCKLSFRTVSVDTLGRSKPADTVSPRAPLVLLECDSGHHQSGLPGPP